MIYKTITEHVIILIMLILIGLIGVKISNVLDKKNKQYKYNPLFVLFAGISGCISIVLSVFFAVFIVFYDTDDIITNNHEHIRSEPAIISSEKNIAYSFQHISKSNRDANLNVVLISDNGSQRKLTIKDDRVIGLDVIQNNEKDAVIKIDYIENNNGNYSFHSDMALVANHDVNNLENDIKFTFLPSDDLPDQSINYRNVDDMDKQRNIDRLKSILN